MISLPDGQGGDDGTDHQEIGPPRKPRPRPRSIRGVTEEVHTGHGNMYVTINFDEAGTPFEVFGALGKAGTCDSAQLEAISRLISLALRSGIDAQEVISELRGITCCPAWDNGILMRSGPDAIALTLERYLKPAFPRESPSDIPIIRHCLNCDSPLSIGEGAAICTACG